MSNRSAPVFLVMIAMILCTGALRASAQGRLMRIHPPNPPVHHGGGWRNVDYPTPEKRAENLAQLLGLSDEQKQKVVALFTEQDEKSNEILANSSLTQQRRTARIDALRDATVKQVRELLTDEQQKKYDAIAPAKPTRPAEHYDGP